MFYIEFNIFDQSMQLKVRTPLSEGTSKKLALEQSIEKWRIITEYHKSGVNLPLEAGGTTTCALCQKYWENFECRGCPVSEVSNQFTCRRTPYVTYCQNPTLLNAESELDFLKGLREYPNINEKEKTHE